MAITRAQEYEPAYDCKVSDLVNGFPPADSGVEGAKMYVWDDTTKTLVDIYKKVQGAWNKL